MNEYDLYNMEADPYGQTPVQPTLDLYGETAAIEPNLRADVQTAPAPEPDLAMEDLYGAEGMGGDQIQIPERRFSGENALATALAAAVPLLLGATSDTPGAMGFAGEGAAKSATTALDLITKENDRLSKGDLYAQNLTNQRNTRMSLEKFRQEQQNKRAQEQQKASTERTKMLTQAGLTKQDKTLAEKNADDEERAKRSIESGQRVISRVYDLEKAAAEKVGKTIQPFDEWKMKWDGATLQEAELALRAAEKENVDSRDTANKMVNANKGDLYDSQGIYNAGNLGLKEGEAIAKVKSFDATQKKVIEKAAVDAPKILDTSAKLRDALDEKQSGVPQNQWSPMAVRKPDGTIVPAAKVKEVLQRRYQLFSTLITDAKIAFNMGASFTSMEKELIEAMIGAKVPSGVTKLSDLVGLIDSGEIRGIDFNRGVKFFMEKAVSNFDQTLRGTGAGIDPVVMAKRNPKLYALIKQTDYGREALKTYNDQISKSGYYSARRKGL